MIKVKMILFVILFIITFMLIPIYAFSDNQNDDASIIEETVKKYANISGDLEEEDFESVKDIAIFSKGLSDISYLTKFKNLERLDLSHNNIEDISPIATLTNLKYLSFDGNKVKDISALTKLVHLEELSIVSNRIENIGSLGKLKSLKRLFFSNNFVSDISPLKSLNNLCLLGGSNNKIKDISVLNYLPNVNTIYLDGNPIKDYSALVKIYDYIESDISFGKVNKKESILSDVSISTLDLPQDISKVDAFGLAHSSDIILTGNGKSFDGVEWNLSSNTVNYNVTFDGEKFIKIEGNVFSYSFDGEKWINKKIANDMTNITISKIVKCNKKYIAIGGKKKNYMPWHGIIATSINGINWSIFESKDIPDFSDIAWNGKEYIVIGYHSALKSSDGEKWVKTNVDKNSSSLRLINWNGKQFIIIGYSRNEGYISFISPDGKHWSKENIISDKNLDYHLFDMIWDDKKYIVVGSKYGGYISYPYIIYSYDGVKWMQSNSVTGHSEQICRIAKFKSKYFAVGWDTTILSSNDGIEWSVVQDDPKDYFKDKIRSPYGYYAIDCYGEIYVSKDDMKWNKLSIKSDWCIDRLLYKDNKIFAFGKVIHSDGSSSDVLGYSEDGLKWNTIDTVRYPSEDKLDGIRMCNEYFLLPVKECIYKSRDGVQWDKLDYKLEYGTIEVECFDNRNYIFITNLGVILETPDLMNFKVLHREDEKFRAIKKLIWDGNKYLVLKYCYFSNYNVMKIGIMYSENLTAWDELMLDYNYSTEDLFLTKAGYYIIGDEFVLFSIDGIEWERKYYRYKKLKHLE